MTATEAAEAHKEAKGMKLRTVLLFGLLLSACAQAQFEGDSRLDRKITFRAEAESVRAVLKRLTDETGVSLSSANALDEDLLVLYVRERPLKETLTILADHFGWTWEKRDDGYHLRQTKEARDEEERLRNEAILRPYLEVRNRLRKRLEEVSSPEAIERKRKEMVQLRAQAKLLAEEGRLQESWQLSARIDLLEGLVDPWQRLSRIAFANLTPGQLMELDFRGRIVLSTHPTLAQHPIQAPKEALRAVAQHVAESNRRFFARVEKEERLELIERASLRPMSPDEIVRLRLVFEHGETSPGIYDMNLGLRVAYWNSRGQMWSPFGGSGGWPEFPPGRRTPPPITERETNRLDGVHVRGEAFDSAVGTFARGGSSMGGSAWKAFMQAGSKTDPLSGVAKTLIAIAAASGVSLIADSYDEHRYAYSRPAAQARTAGDLFDFAVSALKADRNLDGDWVRARTRDWALARYSTVPRSVLFSVRDQTRRQQGMTLNQLAALAVDVNDNQARSPFLQIIGQQWDRMNRGAPLYTLRFWHTVGDSGRRALRSGQPIEFLRLPPEPKAHLTEAVYRLGLGSGTEPAYDPEEASVFEWADGLWMDYGNVHDDGSYKEGEVTQILPNGPPGSATVELRNVQHQGLCVQSEAPYYSFMSTSYFAYLESDIWGNNPPSLTESKVKFATFDRYFFTLRLTPEYVRGVYLRAATSDPSKPFFAYSELPEAFRQRIERAKEIVKQKFGGMVLPAPSS